MKNNKARSLAWIVAIILSALVYSDSWAATAKERYGAAYQAAFDAVLSGNGRGASVAAKEAYDLAVSLTGYKQGDEVLKPELIAASHLLAATLAKTPRHGQAVELWVRNYRSYLKSIPDNEIKSAMAVFPSLEPAREAVIQGRHSKAIDVFEKLLPEVGRKAGKDSHVINGHLNLLLVARSMTGGVNPYSRLIERVAWQHRRTLEKRGYLTSTVASKKAPQGDVFAEFSKSYLKASAALSKGDTNGASSAVEMVLRTAARIKTEGLFPGKESGLSLAKIQQQNPFFIPGKQEVAAARHIQILAMYLNGRKQDAAMGWLKSSMDRLAGPDMGRVVEAQEIMRTATEHLDRQRWSQAAAEFQRYIPELENLLGRASSIVSFYRGQHLYALANGGDSRGVLAVAKQVIEFDQAALQKLGYFSSEGVASAELQKSVGDKKIKPAENKNKVTSLTQKAVDLVNSGRIQQALQAGREAESLASQYFGKESLEYADALSALVSAMIVEEQHSKLVDPDTPKLAKRVVDLRTRLLGANHIKVGDALAQLSQANGNVHGVFNSSRGASNLSGKQFQDITQPRERALKIYLGQREPDGMRIAASQCLLASMYQDAGRVPSDPQMAARFEKITRTNERMAAGDKAAIGAFFMNCGASSTTLMETAALIEHGKENEKLLLATLTSLKKASPADPKKIARAKHRLGEYYRLQGRFDRARPVAEEALNEMSQAVGADHLDTARSLFLLARIYEALGDHKFATELAGRALNIRERRLPGDHHDVADVLELLGRVEIRSGHLRNAEEYLQKAFDIRGRLLEPPGRYGFGKAHYITVDEKYVGSALLYSQALLKLGRADAAQEVLLKAMAAMGQRKDGLLEAAFVDVIAVGVQAGSDRGTLSNTYEQNTLVPALETAQRIYGEQHPKFALITHFLASAAEAKGKAGDALSLSGQAAKIVRDAQVVAGVNVGADDVAWWDAPQRKILESHLDRLIRLAGQGAGTFSDERFEDSFLTGQGLVRARSSEAIARMAARFAGGGERIGQTVFEHQQAVDRLNYLQKSLVGLLGQKLSVDGQKTERKIRTELETTKAKIKKLEGILANKFPRYNELIRQMPQPVSRVKELLKPDEVLLVYVSAEDATYLWALRKDGARFHKLPEGRQFLVEQISKLREGLDPDLNTDGSPFDVMLAHDLYSRLIGPVEPFLANGSKILVVPDGPIVSLPFATLVSQRPDGPIKPDGLQIFRSISRGFKLLTGDQTAEAPTPDTEAKAAEEEGVSPYASISWLVGDHDLSAFPSVSSFVALRKTAKPSTAPNAFLGVGDPQLEGGKAAASEIETSEMFSRGGVANTRSILSLPRLPETADEIKKLADAFGASEKDMLLADKATEVALRTKELSLFKNIGFSTHAVIENEIQGLKEPALVVTPPKAVAGADNDGLLTATEIATLQLNADWAILAACNTARDGRPNAYGLSRLTQAFLYAGARSLLVSHWKVDSKATLHLVTGTVEKLATNPALGRAGALREAILHLIQGKVGNQYAHPMYWAPFFVIGG